MSNELQPGAKDEADDSSTSVTSDETSQSADRALVASGQAPKAGPEAPKKRARKSEAGDKGSERNDERRMTFTEHLGELRDRIIRSGVAVLVGFLVCYGFSNQMFRVVARPLTPLLDAGFLAGNDEDSGQTDEGKDASGDEQPKWTALNPLEPFLVRLKLAAYGGLLLALPFVVYQICAFIFPGLTLRERKAARILLLGCTALVILGVGVAYFLTFPLVLPYLMKFAPEGVVIQLRMNETVALVLKGLMGFALAFQFPMVVLILVYLELLTPATLRQYRKFAIVIAAVVGAAFTPPDPFSMIVMMLPLVVLYEISIWVSYIVTWRRHKEASAS